MRIRSAEPGDASQFAELNRRFNGESGRLSSLGNGSERLLVAEVGSRLVGFACVQIHRSVCSVLPWAEFTELFVNVAHRRSGVGAALVAEVERLAWEAGCSELVLRASANNFEARALFRQVGFDEVPHVVFRKRGAPMIRPAD